MYETTPPGPRYMGYDAHRYSVWKANANGMGGLFYWYEPSIHFFDVPTSKFQRAKVSPYVDLMPTNMIKLISDSAALSAPDARSFIEDFDISSTHFERLAEYFWVRR